MSGGAYAQVKSAAMAARREYDIREWFGYALEIVHDGGPEPAEPLVKAVAGVVVKNPFAGQYVEDISALTRKSGLLGTALGLRASALLGGRAVEGYGKGGVSGTAGEQEHVVACLTTVFGDAVRAAVGGGHAWISSSTKSGPPGCGLDLPLAYKDEIYVRSHYDTVTVSVADAPRSNELLLCVAVASRGRIHHRVGGLTVGEVAGRLSGMSGDS